MAKTLETRLRIKSWDEHPYRELDDGQKFTKAEVLLEGGEDGLTSATFESLMYYRADGTATYVTLMRITGTLDGRSGGFVLDGHGTFDGKEARGELRVVADSGTDGLTGLRGRGQSVSTHDDYPFMPLTLTYDLPNAAS